MATLVHAKLLAAASSLTPAHKVLSFPLHPTEQGFLLYRPLRVQPRWVSRVRPTRPIKPMMCSNILSEGSNSDEEYINSTVLEAVEVKSGSEGFLIKMRDGRYIKCVHNNPDGGRLPDYAPQPAIVLKVEDGSDLLLPIIVLELPATTLMETLRNVHIVRPTIYQVLKDLIELMGFKAKLVRVTKRVQEAYYAQLFLSKQLGEEVQEVCLDLRPSDAINVAARCQVPIQVNRHLAYGDGVRIVNDPAKIHTRSSSSSRLQGSSGGLSLFMELDRGTAHAARRGLGQGTAGPPGGGVQTAPSRLCCASDAEAHDVEYLQGETQGNGLISDKGKF